MPVSVETALQTVRAIRSAGHQAAILHGAEKLRSGGSLGDLDLITGKPAERVILDSSAALYDLGWRLVMQWRYDQTGHSFLFMDSSRDHRCYQIDLLHDPHGVGPYGLKTTRVLGSIPHGAEGDDLPEILPHTRLAYLIIKGSVKRQVARIQELESMVRQWDASDRRRLEAVVRAHFVPSVEHWVLDMTGGKRRSFFSQERLRRRYAQGVTALQRVATRLLFPPGLIIDHVPTAAGLPPLGHVLSGQAPAGIRDLRSRSRVLSEIGGTIRLLRPGVTILSHPLTVASSSLDGRWRFPGHLGDWAELRHEYSMSQLASARRVPWL